MGAGNTKAQRNHRKVLQRLPPPHQVNNPQQQQQQTNYKNNLIEPNEFHYYQHRLAPGNGNGNCGDHLSAKQVLHSALLAANNNNNNHHYDGHENQILHQAGPSWDPKIPFLAMAHDDIHISHSMTNNIITNKHKRDINACQTLQRNSHRTCRTFSRSNEAPDFLFADRNFGHGDGVSITNNNPCSLPVVPVRQPPIPHFAEPEVISIQGHKFKRQSGFSNAHRASISNITLNSFVASQNNNNNSSQIRNYQFMGPTQTNVLHQYPPQNNKTHHRRRPSDCENDSSNSENDYDSGTGSSLSLYVALHDFKPENEYQLALTDGEIINIKGRTRFGDWCEAVTNEGKRGWVPYNYIVPIRLSKHHWYHGRISRETAEYLLANSINGCFLVRESQSRPGSKSISIYYAGQVLHYRITEENGKFFIISGWEFSTLPKLVHHYSLGEYGLVTALLYPLPRLDDRSANDVWEIDRSDMLIHHQIGYGQWGLVNEATWKKYQLRVAIKSLREEMTHLEGEFLLEAELMKNMRHPNLVQLLGVCTQEAPIYIVTEFMTKGNLQDYLRNCDHDQVNGFVLMSMASQVCSAMSYLEAHSYIHRDLAARNCLVSDNYLVKVADFGLTRQVKLGDTYTAEVGAKFPIKWTAPEGLQLNKFTSKSDVWSFGVLLWEISTYGMVPYPGVELAEVFEILKSGYRMGRPTGCPDPVYQFMRQCWFWEASDRPTFWQLHNQLESLLMSSDFFELIEQQMAIDKEQAEEEEQLMKMKNLIDCEQQEEQSTEQDQSTNALNSDSLLIRPNSDEPLLEIQYPLANGRLSISQFDTKWAIEECNRQQQLQYQQQQQQHLEQFQQQQQSAQNNDHNNETPFNNDRQSVRRSTSKKKFAPKPPKRTSSCREQSYQDTKASDNNVPSRHGSESTQYESGVSLSNIGEYSSSTIDGLTKLFQSLSSQGQYSTQQDSALNDGNCNGLGLPTVMNSSNIQVLNQETAADSGSRLFRPKSKPVTNKSSSSTVHVTNI